jgi:biotin carboxylase
VGEALIVNPYAPYARMLIRRLWRNHGIRTVCLHTDWFKRITLEGRYSLLRSSAVAAHYMLVESSNWELVADELRKRHDIVGVLPYEEGLVQPLSELASALDLSWAQPETLSAFRDKRALKQRVADADPTVRLNFFRDVSSPRDVFDAVRERNLERFVLKPNSGSGNQHVAFFDTGTSPAVMQRYFEKAGDRVLLEEFVHGPEFWVNGQMDARGEPIVVGIGTYYRVAANGIANLEVGSISLQPNDPHFPVLRAYAERVMRATGLRRSPFHLEAIIDQDGPCLVEVAARLCGELGAVLDMEHHGPQLDLLDIAAQYYVSDAQLPPIPLDWNRVAMRWVASATGDSAYDQRLTATTGADEVEGSSHFLFWIKRPEPGDYVQRTVSLTTRPWSVALTGDLDTNPWTVIDDARNTVRLHGTASDHLTTVQKWPMYQGLMAKAWRSRPRLYEAAALWNPLP